MARAYINQLRDRDPSVRKAAIKAAARAVDRSALKRLAIMCEDDPDAEVRDLARKAGVYIRQQLGELPTAEQADDPTNGKRAKPQFNVSADAQMRSKKLIDNAVAYQLNNEMSKALKLLQQAYALNPNLREDGYFKSVAEAVTQSSGDEMFAQLSDRNAYNNYSKKEIEQRKQAILDAHIQEISKAKGLGVALDLGVLLLVTFVAAVFALTVATQAAAGYVDAVFSNWLAADESAAAGKMRVLEDGTVIYESLTELNAALQPLTFTRKEPDPGFWQTAQQIAETEMGAIVGASLALAVGVGVAVLLMSGVIHVISASILRGKGRLAYTAHRVASMLTMRMMVAAGAGTFGVLLTFGVLESQTGFLVMGGLLGLVALFTLLSLGGAVGKAYNLSAGAGLIAVTPAIAGIAGALFVVVSASGQMSA